MVGALVGSWGPSSTSGPTSVTDDHFLLTYGDGVTDLDVSELVRFHISHGKIGTVTGVPPLSRFGELRTKGNLVIDFAEKPLDVQNYISGGFFVFRREFFERLPVDDECVLEEKPLR